SHRSRRRYVRAARPDAGRTAARRPHSRSAWRIDGRLAPRTPRQSRDGQKEGRAMKFHGLKRMVAAPLMVLALVEPLAGGAEASVGPDVFAPASGDLAGVGSRGFLR